MSEAFQWPLEISSTSLVSAAAIEAFDEDAAGFDAVAAEASLSDAAEAVAAEDSSEDAASLFVAASSPASFASAAAAGSSAAWLSAAQTGAGIASPRDRNAARTTYFPFPCMTETPLEGFL
ncbi:hypothetical protein VXJ24_10605 [Olsenella sp. YH-ols2221]|uniref:hypothetical protein n=1 Tax=Olsenella kribbiana TaxID=3115221 RepID=UPI002ED90D50